MAEIKQATGNTVTEVTAQSILGSKVASKGWRALIIANQMNFLYPKDYGSMVGNLISTTNLKGMGRIKEIKNLHYAKRGSLSKAERKEYPEGLVRARRESSISAGRIILKNARNSAILDKLGKDPFTYSDDLISDKMPEQGEDILNSLDRENKLEDALGSEFQKSNKNHSSIPQNEIIIFNLHTSPYSSLVIQNRPTEVQVSPSSSWVAVRSMGRNNPFYMYTGGEDTLSFEISWFVNDPSHIEEVVAKCRILESWSKADAYNQAPPTLKISWGNSNLFGNYDWILESCPYRLTNFQNASRDSVGRLDLSRNTGMASVGVIDKQLYPACAVQNLTFKKVTFNNSTWSNQIGMPVKGIKGINDRSYYTTV